MYEIYWKYYAKVTEDVSVVRNVAAEEAEEPRGNENWVDAALRYVTQHDVVLALPGDSTLTVSPRRLAEDQVTATLRFPTNNGRSMEEGTSSNFSIIEPCHTNWIAFLLAPLKYLFGQYYFYSFVNWVIF